MCFLSYMEYSLFVFFTCCNVCVGSCLVLWLLCLFGYDWFYSFVFSCVIEKRGLYSYVCCSMINFPDRFLEMFEVHIHNTLQFNEFSRKVVIPKVRYDRRSQCRSPCAMDSHNAVCPVRPAAIMLAERTTDSHSSYYGKTDSYIAGSPVW